MARLALISRHIVSYRASVPLYGVILIEDEEIDDIVIVDENIPVQALLSKFRDWNPLNYENQYISPGIIDIGVRAEWEGKTNITQMAASGGVTFLLQEKSICNEENEPSTFKLYCDVGQIIRIDSTNFNDITALRHSGAFAFKGYLYPPSWMVPALPDDLPAVFSNISEIGVPLIIDSSLPQTRMLFMASPCRHLNLKDRLVTEIKNENEFFAAAFPDSTNPVLSDEEDEEIMVPQQKNKRTRSNCIKCSVRFSGQFPNEVRMSRPVEALKKLIENPMLERSRTGYITKNRRRSSYHDIYEDLDYRVKINEANIAALIKAEQKSYENAGKTVFSKSINRQRSSSFNEFKYREPEETQPMTARQKRLKGKRPIPLSTNNEEFIDSQKDRQYLNHLVNIPDKWEAKGVEKVLEILQAETCKVHFSNLSSASAINKIRQQKKHIENVTCETAPHYLCFNDQDIRDGDTRFKDYPPIRSKENSQLLWDLLKMKAIDVISSHHATIPIDYKNIDNGSFKKALNGVNGLGFAMQAIWTGLCTPSSTVSQREHYIVRLSKWFSLHPAKLLGINHRRGSIDRGKFADLIIWDPYEHVHGNSNSAYKESCIYQGKKLLGKISKVYLRGKVVYNEGNFYSHGARLSGI
ncbi:unnamed protein product [Blepharisma stoltei]|uniref:Amidohydrolase-related domain-containing protein n=1 Tax=Blepharisma stoltei TaxID=1481888 RepID=A0AAU9JV56_9CILI|nr:unnamed protein product [Blepharisma stoltei]